MKNSKPYKYSSKDRLEKTPSKMKKKKKEEVSENTIKIDDVRLNDSESLDTSFLEGRIEKKVSNSKKAKERILANNEETLKKIRVLRKIFLTLSLICIILLVFLYFSDTIKTSISQLRVTGTETNEEVKKVSNIDSNYLFVGDSYTYRFNFNQLGLDYHYVKVSNLDLTMESVLNHMKESIYDYNPSIVFLQFSKGSLSNEDYLYQMELLVKYIQRNRPNAMIYVESLYPVHHVDEGITNNDIRSMNELLSDMCRENKVQYLDVYSLLVLDGKLNSSYTDDGININENGYRQIYKMIQKIVG